MLECTNSRERSPVAHFVRDEGVAGSNPVIPILYFFG